MWNENENYQKKIMEMDKKWHVYIKTWSKFEYLIMPQLLICATTEMEMSHLETRVHKKVNI